VLSNCHNCAWLVMRPVMLKLAGLSDAKMQQHMCDGDIHCMCRARVQIGIGIMRVRQLHANGFLLV
jgi:hypothetical protein